MQMKVRCIREFPAINPGQPITASKPGFSERSAADATIVIKSFAADVGHGKMSKFQIIHDKTRTHRDALARRSKAISKKRNLITKFSSIFPLEIAGKVPPFGPEAVVRQMIQRKCDLITWDGKTPSFGVGFLSSTRHAENAKYQNDEYPHHHASILI